MSRSVLFVTAITLILSASIASAQSVAISKEGKEASEIVRSNNYRSIIILSDGTSRGRALASDFEMAMHPYALNYNIDMGNVVGNVRSRLLDHRKKKFALFCVDENNLNCDQILTAVKDAKLKATLYKNAKPWN